VPGYYYRMESATQYINCTACGNTLATDKKMFKNYMMQSLKFWAEEYHVDGFRFDLMGAHDYQIMNEIRSMFDGMYGGEGKKIIMYGEPWTGTGGFSGLNAANQCTINNAAKLAERIGCFNDTTRDAIQKWFKSDVQANLATVKAGITSTTKSGLKPNKSLTYFDCHDGVTWWDNIQASNGKQYDSTNASHTMKLRTSMTYLFTSQGVPFMLAGTEFARTKYGNGNSYNLGDVNAFDWMRIETYATEVAYVKGLREIRNAFSPFRSSSNVVNPSYISTSSNVIAYTLNNSKAGEWSKALVIMNNGSASSVTLPSGTWTVVADGTKAGLVSLGTASGSYSIPANGSAILVQGETTATSATYEKVTVKHVADGKTIKTTESLYAVGDTWRAVPDNYTMFNHNVKSIESNAGTKLGNTYYGTVEAGKDVVVTITYESFNTDGYVTIKYVDEKGASISQDITFRMLDGEEFNLPFSNVSGYELVSSKYPANYKGTFDSSNPATITFVYKQLEVESIDVYYYNTKWGNNVGMYAYTDSEDKPLGAWGEKAQRMTKVTDASELPKGETVGNWYKKSISDDNSKLDYHITSCNVMFHNMGQGEQEPLNGEPGYVASGTVYIKNKVLSFNTDIVVSHIDAETGEKLADDERISFTNVSLKDTYETKAKEGFGEVIVPTNAKGNVVAGSICVVYLYGEKEEVPTTTVTEPASSEVPTSGTTEPASSEVPTSGTTEPASSEIPSTVEPGTTATNPGEIVDPLYLGDADLSGVINIKDVTLIQKHAAQLLMLVGDNVLCADAYTDNEVNIKDATIIQKYLAKYENLGYPVGEAIPGTGEWVTLPVITPATTVTVAPSTTKATEASTTAEPSEVITTTEPTTAELTTTEPTTAELTTEPTTAEPVITEPSEIVTDPYEDPTDPPVYGEAKTVYFSNNKFWQGEVYAYIWDANDYKPAEWPGLPMTFVKTNDYGESIFSVEVPAGMTYIIFTDGSSQSVDIDLTLESQNGFYLTDADAEGKYAYGTYDFV
ncbi:MAG: starch-binding protein, partial [Ruminococcus sp.]|nr:starch-binding protein [Ruminococcus sp.]